MSEYKVVVADYGITSKVVGLLDKSTDEIEWTNKWISEHSFEIGNRAHSIRITYFNSLDTQPILGSTMVHVIDYSGWDGKVVRYG